MADPGVTELLIDWSKGDNAALERLMPLVYEELRNVARHHLSREQAGHTLQSTALVHEVYLQLVDQDRVQWRNRAQFFAVAAQMIRRILVDHARARQTEKRGGSTTKLSLIESIAMPKQKDVDLVALDDALSDLSRLDPQQAQVIELRFFAGLTIVESAEALGVSPATVHRDWVTAKAWLFRELNRTEDSMEDGRS
jgi:RNA polymerase sigma factor (TIGR02999 family)